MTVSSPDKSAATSLDTESHLSLPGHYPSPPLKFAYLHFVGVASTHSLSARPSLSWEHILAENARAALAQEAALIDAVLEEKR